MTKYCKSCGEEKHYVLGAKGKASGFHGAKGWSCYLAYQNAVRPAYYSVAKRLQYAHS